MAKPLALSNGTILSLSSGGLIGMSADAETPGEAFDPPDFAPEPFYDQATADLVEAIPRENVKTLTVTEASAGTGAHFSGGTVPTTSNDVEIGVGETLHVYDAQELNGRYIWVDGTLVLHGGCSLTADTVFVAPETGILYNTGVSASKRIEWTVLTETDIDVANDTELISRGLVNGGSIRISGPARQRLLPIANDVEAGVTTGLTFKTPPFVGFGGSGGETAFALDWSSTDMYALAATELKGPTYPSGNAGLANELIQLSSFTPNVNATTFSPFDPEGSTGTLATTAVWDHLEYWDSVALAKAREFGPPEGSPTFGSHSNWAGRPWIYNLSKYIVFKKSDPDCPIHRNPIVLLYSRHSHIEHCEFQGGSTGWGRSSVAFENFTIIPGSETHAADDNLRFRNAIQIWKAGWRLPADRVSDDVPRVKVLYNSLWGGTVGDAKTNAEEGAGGPGAFIQSWASEALIQGNVSYNTFGPCTWHGTPWETGECIENAAMSVWGDRPDGRPTGVKTTTYYLIHDTGRSGDGHFSYARQILSKRQIAHGCAGAGIMFFTRVFDGVSRQT